MERLLFKLGFKRVRQKGSHVFYRHPDGRYTTVPHHKGRMLARPLVREILKEIKIDVEEYSKYLQEL
jgi:predicted RNA binding protein YcfA (HicA-like mRNA interferase family)